MLSVSVTKITWKIGSKYLSFFSNLLSDKTQFITIIGNPALLVVVFPSLKRAHRRRQTQGCLLCSFNLFCFHFRIFLTKQCFFKSPTRRYMYQNPIAIQKEVEVFQCNKFHLKQWNSFCTTLSKQKKTDQCIKQILVHNIHILHMYFSFFTLSTNVEILSICFTLPSCMCFTHFTRTEKGHLNCHSGNW